MLEEFVVLVLRALDTSEKSSSAVGGKFKQMQEKAKNIRLAIPLNLSGYSVLNSVAVSQTASTRAVTTKGDDGNSVEITEPIVGEGNLNISFTVQPEFTVGSTGFAIPVPFAIVDTALQKAINLDDKLLVFDYISSSVVRLGHRIVSYNMDIDSNSNSARFSISLAPSKNEGVKGDRVVNYMAGTDKQTSVGFGG